MTQVQEHNYKILNEDPEELLAALKQQGGLRLSILLPIATEPPQSDQNASRLKDLKQDAFGKLKENGVKDDKAVDFLQPIEALLNDPKSLLQPAKALALFVDENDAYMVHIPYMVDSQVTVGNRFVIKPLLPLLQHDSNYTLVCLNREDTKVFQGTRLGLRQADVPGMPKSLEEFTKFDDPEKSVQHHTAKTGSAEGSTGNAPVPQVHGHGLPSDMESSQSERFFHEVAKTVKKFLANNHSPIVLLGVDENIGHFRSAVDWGNQTIFTIHHDSKDWSMDEILHHANETLMPYWKEKIAEKTNILEEAYNKDSGVFDTGKCVIDAANARLEIACVASDKTEPGLCQPEEMKVEFVESDDPGCAHDLLDTIAFETIQHGGEAFSLPADEIPGPGNAAASVRY